MIRRYRQEDRDEALRVWAAASEPARWFLSERFLEAERHEIRTGHLPNADTWVWEVRGEVLGFISLVGSEVGAMFVDPRFHGSGIGTALMAHARALRGDLEVEVFKDNVVGRASMPHIDSIDAGVD